MSRIAALSVLFASSAMGQTFSVTVSGASYQVDRYLPSGTPPFPIVALGHGFSNSKANVQGLAQALQADGIVVVAPQFPAASGDHARNAAVMLAAVDATVSAGLGDGQRLGLGGHSAGALAAWLAAAQRSSRVVVLLDPVDSNGLGTAQIANVSAPVLFEFAPSQTCNTNNNSLGWFTGKSGAKGRFNVPNANHCDPQEPSNVLCTTGCGFATWNAQRSAVYKRFARAMFGQFLLGASTCVETLALADQQAGTIDQVVMQLGCGAVDGGTAGGAAGGGNTGGGSAGGAVGGGVAGGGSAGGAVGGGAAGGGSAGGGSAGGASAGGGLAGGGSAGGSSGGGAALVCSASTCANGCCNGVTCEAATERTCGVSGGPCAICGPEQVCAQGLCVAASSPGGCSCGASGVGVLGLVAAWLSWLARRRR